MSYAFEAAVQKIGPIKRPVQRHVLGVLAHIADDWGFVSMEVETIADKTQYSDKTVRRTLIDLAQGDWLKVDRKMMGGKGNIYTLNGPKLGVAPGERSKRSPLWSDMIRLTKMLAQSEGRVTSENGVLKFEKPINSEGMIESGDLFCDELSPVTVTGEFQPKTEANVIHPTQNASIRAKRGQTPLKVGEEGENSPVTVTGEFGANGKTHRSLCPDSPVTLSAPFNVLTRSSLVSTKDKYKDRRADRATDPRNSSFKIACNAYAEHMGVPAVWGGPEAGTLAELLRACPALTLEAFQTCLQNRARSPAAVHSDRPKLWIPTITRYLQGPLNAFNQPEGSNERKGKTRSSLDAADQAVAIIRARGQARRDREAAGETRSASSGQAGNGGLPGSGRGS